MKDSILLVTDELSPGGVARHVTDLANGLAEKGIRSIVAATDGPFRSRLHNEVRFVELPLLDPHSGRKRLSGFPSSYSILKKILRRESIALIHSHKRYTDALGRVLARRMSLPHISTCHNTFSSLKHFSSFGDTTIACSKAVQEMLIKEFKKDPETIKLIYSAIVPFKKYQEGEAKQILKNMFVSDGKRIVGSVGQLIAAKDRVTLMRAIGILRGRNVLDNVLFAILGEGEQKTMLEELILKEKIGDHVIFLHGLLDVEEALINASEFMVLSSRQEGLPYVLLEAASVGKPHIATDVGGVSEFVIHGRTGILVPPSDPERLANAIQSMLEKPETAKELGMNAREKYLQQFNYGRFIGQTLEVYRPYL